MTDGEGALTLSPINNQALGHAGRCAVIEGMPRQMEIPHAMLMLVDAVILVTSDRCHPDSRKTLSDIQTRYNDLLRRTDGGSWNAPQEDFQVLVV